MTVQTAKLIKIKNEYVLTVPNSIIKLYALKEGQMFNLETREGVNPINFVFLTYATILK
jgi:hypothetical protein